MNTYLLHIFIAANIRQKSLWQEYNISEKLEALYNYYHVFSMQI